MPDTPRYPRYKIGDEVRLIHGSRLVGRIMEARPALVSTAHVLYTVYVPMEPEPLKIPVREEEIEKV